jgi:hypothetical protein
MACLQIRVLRCTTITQKQYFVLTLRSERCHVAVWVGFGVAVPGFRISTSDVSTDSSRVCANPLVPW